MPEPMFIFGIMFGFCVTFFWSEIIEAKDCILRWVLNTPEYLPVTRYIGGSND